MVLGTVSPLHRMKALVLIVVGLVVVGNYHRLIKPQLWFQCLVKKGSPDFATLFEMYKKESSKNPSGDAPSRLIQD